MKFMFNFRKAAHLSWTALALLATLVAPCISRAQALADSEAQLSAAISAPGSMFPHQVGENLRMSGQVNFIFQAHPTFDAPYSGPNSLQSAYDRRPRA
jgi:hypothetical protein